ncbi:hypothetical protein COD94_14210 [Bacillus cereus]|nr:hypothetical protein COD94_14210 [Bacillus cereus]
MIQNFQFYRVVHFLVGNYYVKKQNVTVVTGLPSNHFELEKPHTALKSLCGTYKVNNFEFTIEEIIVEQQALATAIYMGADLKGNIKKDSEVFLNAEVLPINIGMGTTEVVEETEELKTDSDEEEESSVNFNGNTSKSLFD